VYTRDSVCVCVYTHTHNYVHTKSACNEAHSRARDDTHTHTCTHTHTHTHTHTDDLSHLYCRCLDEYPRCTHIHADTHTQTHKHRQTHTNTSTHTHTYESIPERGPRPRSQSCPPARTCVYVTCEVPHLVCAICRNVMPQCYYVCHDAFTCLCLDMPQCYAAMVCAICRNVIPHIPHT